MFVSCADFVKVPTWHSARRGPLERVRVTPAVHPRLVGKAAGLPPEIPTVPSRPHHLANGLGRTSKENARRPPRGRARASERASEAKCSFRVLIWSKSPPGRVLGVDPLRECELLPPFTRARVNLSLHVDHDDDDDVVQSTHPQSVCTAVAACRILPQGVEKKHDNV